MIASLLRKFKMEVNKESIRKNLILFQQLIYFILFYFQHNIYIYIIWGFVQISKGLCYVRISEVS